MITFKTLGSYGRLGNQLFQYAALRGIAANNNEQWKIPHPSVKGTTDYSLFQCFKMESVKEENFLSRPGERDFLYGFAEKKQRVFEFDPSMFNNVKNVNISGYFQTEKYFINVKDIVLSDYTFHDEIVERANKVLSGVKNPVFFHIRRSDNVGFPHLVNDPTLDNYYTRAMQYFSVDSTFVICSDDMEWCKQQDFFKNDKFVFSEDNKKFDTKCELNYGGNPRWENSSIPFVDLCVMSLCNGGIIPTSSLSWWGAYMQKNRTNNVVVQDPWFGPTLMKNNNTKDIIPEGWIKLRGV
jgi:hypothetical protein